MEELRNVQVIKLIQYINARDYEHIEKMCLQGVPNLINACENGPNGKTPLIAATIENDEIMVKYLLENTAHPNIQDNKGRTPAMFAMKYGHMESLKLLLDDDQCKTDIVDCEGRGILFYGLVPTERHKKCMAMALEKSADVNNIDINGIPILLFSCQTANDNEETCLSMIEQGADPNKVHFNGTPSGTKQSALMAACDSGSVNVVRLLLEKKADPNLVDHKGRMAAHFAAKKGFLEILMLLSAYNCDFNILEHKTNRTAVHLAAINGNGPCCRFMAQRGCNAKLKDSEGITAKVYAKGKKACAKEVGKAERFYTKISKPESELQTWMIKLYDWWTANSELINYKIAKFDPNLTKMVSVAVLTSIFEELNPPNFNSDNFLEWIDNFAQPGGEEKMINYTNFLMGKGIINKQFLVAAYADKKKKKKQKQPKPMKKLPFQLPTNFLISQETRVISDYQQTDTNRFDKDHPPNDPLEDDSAWYIDGVNPANVSINWAVKGQDIETLNKCFYEGNAIDTVDRFYRTPLMIACNSGDIKMAKYFVEHGALLNTQDNMKWTPLHHACHSGRLDLVSFLVDSGADVNAVSLNGGTPITRAIEASAFDVVKYLLESCGAKLRTETRTGKTPLELSYDWSDPNLIEYLEEKFSKLPPIKKNAKKAPPKKAQQKASELPQVALVRKKKPKNLDTDSSFKLTYNLERPQSVIKRMESNNDGIFYSKNIWRKQMTTRDIIKYRVEQRERYGWEIDFEDFKMPFSSNISNKLINLNN